MDHIEKTVEIKAPLEKVWVLISNLERIPEWAEGYTEREVITSKQRTGVGTTTHEVGVALGKAYEKSFIITEWVEKEKIVFESISGWPWKGKWVMKPTKEGTLFTYAVDFKCPLCVDRMREVFHKRYQTLIEKWVQNIKSILEK